MPIDFPSGPTTGDVYTYQGKSWIWNGSAWDPVTPAYGDAFLPAGSIIQWVSNTIPTNWLNCDGSAVSRNTYASLFAAIGTQYGSGDGSTTFNLPDLRGRIALGRDSSQTEFDTLGETGGAKTHTLTTAEMPSHTHTQDAHGHVISANSFAGDRQIAVGPLGGDGDKYSFSDSGNDASTTTANIYARNTTATNQNTGGGAAHNNLQPYQVVNYIIKASAGTTAGDSELATRLGAVEAGKATLTGGNTFTGNQAFNSGVITKPNQPSFLASKNDNGGVYSGDYVFNISIHNTGGNYSTANGRFTAPVTGKYLFMAAIQTYAVDINVVSRVQFRKNGTFYGDGGGGGPDGLQSIVNKMGGSTSHNTINLQLIMHCVAGDYVNVYVENSRAMQSHFSGYLIG